MSATLTLPVTLSNPGYQAVLGAHINNMQNVGLSRFSFNLALPVTAVASTAFTMTIPTGYIVRGFSVATGTAYGAATDATIAIGNVAAGAQYVAATSIKATGVVALTLVGAGVAALLSMPSGNPNLFITVAQTGAASATGSATLFVDLMQSQP